MDRRLLVCAAAALAAAVTVVPGHAAVKKPKPIKGSYAVQLPPDPAADLLFQTGTTDPVDGFCGPSSASQHRRVITIPARGRLEVKLVSENPLPTAPPYGMDWDLYVLDADDEVIDDSTSPTAKEITVSKLKKKQTVTVLVCNLNGAPDATVSYVYTYA